MIVIGNTTRKIQALLGGAVTTNQIPITTHSRITRTSDNTTSLTGEVNTSNNTTAVDIAIAPGNAMLKTVETISIVNTDSAAVTVTVRYNNDGTTFILITTTLDVGDCLYYEKTAGWTVLTSTGALKTQVGESAQDSVGGILTDTDTIDFTYSDATPSITAAVRTQMSITSDSSGIKLSGDETSPGNSEFYGTNGSGTKGWYAQSTLPIPTVPGNTSKNAIINGSFAVWQRGTSFAGITGGFTADLWAFYEGTDGATTVALSTDIPTVAEAGVLAHNSLHVDVTTNDTSIGAAQYAFLAHVIEGYTWRSYAQRELTLSFWVKATKTGTYYVSAFNSGNDRYWTQSYTISTTATWEKKTIVIPASPSAGTWNYTNGRGLRLHWVLAIGSDFDDGSTDGSWATGAEYTSASPAQVNMMDDTANDFRITLVQLEVGDTATDFETVEYGTLFLKCQRYYEIGGYFIVNGDVTSGSTYYGTIMYKATKCVVGTTTPTYVGASNFAASAPTILTQQTDSVTVQKAASGTGSGYYAFSWVTASDIT